MPIVHVYVWSGFSDEAKRKVIAGITNLFTEIGIPEEPILAEASRSERPPAYLTSH